MNITTKTKKGVLLLSLTGIAALLVAMAYMNMGKGSSFVFAFISIALMIVVSGAFLRTINKRGELKATLIGIAVLVIGGGLLSAGSFFVIVAGAIFCTGGLALPVLIGIGNIIGKIFMRNKTGTLKQYVQRAQESGHSDIEIREQFQNDGLSQEQIEQAMKN